MFPATLSALVLMVLLATRSQLVVGNLANASLIPIAQTPLRARAHVARIHATKIPMVAGEIRFVRSAPIPQYARALRMPRETHILSAGSWNAPTTMIVQTQSHALTRIVSIRVRYQILAVKKLVASLKTTLAYVHANPVIPETHS